jgi:hypothetical protein
MPTHHALYSPALDGGSAASHIMRGSMLHSLEVLWDLQVVQLDLFTIGSGSPLIDLGWAGNTTAIYSGIDPSTFSGVVPSVELFGVNFPAAKLHFSPLEPILATVTGGTLLDGSLELLLRYDTP